MDLNNTRSRRRNGELIKARMAEEIDRIREERLNAVRQEYARRQAARRRDRLGPQPADRLRSRFL